MGYTQKAIVELAAGQHEPSHIVKTRLAHRSLPSPQGAAVEVVAVVAVVVTDVLADCAAV
jgi:hypothetical protein